MQSSRVATPADVPVDDKSAEAHILPKANIERMVVASLPPSSKSSLESKILLQHLASEFLTFVTSEADATSKAAQRRVITCEDVFRAFHNLGLARYAGALADFSPESNLSRQQSNSNLSDPGRMPKRSISEAEDLPFEASSGFGIKRQHKIDGSGIFDNALPLAQKPPFATMGSFGEACHLEPFDADLIAFASSTESVPLSFMEALVDSLEDEFFS
jgi:histone H3/H4